jgi:WD40 repeat protein
VAFSPDEKRVATAGSDGAAVLWMPRPAHATARTWDVNTGVELTRFNHGSATVTTAAFSPDGNEVMTGDSAGLAKLWNISSGAERSKFAGSDFGAVTAVAFTSDSERTWIAQRETDSLFRLDANIGPIQIDSPMPNGSSVLAWRLRLTVPRPSPPHAITWSPSLNHQLVDRFRCTAIR